MKVSTPLALLLLALLSGISTIAKGSTIPVQDVYGNPLEVGVPYYILGVSPGAGHVSIGKRTGNEQCPLYVVKNPFTAQPNPPTPVSFYPAKASEKVVHIDEDVNIGFNILNSCPSNVWMVNHDQGSESLYFITTGGQLGNPGCDTLFNWFRIMPIEGASYYKLVVRPRVCDIAPLSEKNVTQVEKDGEYPLYLDVAETGKPPVYVRFQKKARSSIHQVVE